jgi:pyridoxine 5'-phosphate synthase PdxJ
MLSKRPFRELARRDWLRSRISDSESSLKAEMLLAERVTPRKRLLVPHPMQELTSHGGIMAHPFAFGLASIIVASKLRRMVAPWEELIKQRSA